MFYGTLRLWSVLFFIFGIFTLIGAVIGIIVTLFNVDSFWPVSYTHLTLPTTYSA